MIMTSPLINWSAQQLRRAAEIKEQMDSLQNELDQLLGTETRFTDGRRGRGKRRMSAATIARMRAAQKARWAAIKGRSTTRKVSQKGRTKLSRAAKARLSRIAKER